MPPTTKSVERQVSRREFLWNSGGGLGGIALAQLLAEGGLLGEASAADAKPHPAGGLHHRRQGTRVVQFFMSGAASQCDMFDYKPELIARNGQPWDPGEKVELFQSSPGNCMASPWAWKQHGQSGKWMSDLVPHLATCVDDIAFIHSMVSKSNVHGPATFMQNTGFVLPGFPSMGAWVSYGLGSMTDELPAFVVLPDARGFPPNGPGNWSTGFLPAAHQGTLIRPSAANPIADLFPPAGAKFITPDSESDGLQLLKQLNQQHMRRREGDSRLDARIASYELAAQVAARAPRPCSICRVRPSSPARCMGWTKRSPRTSAAIACWRGGCLNEACGSCKFGAAPTMAFRGATGTVTRIWPATTAKWGAAWTSRPRRSSRISKPAACWTTRS